MKQYYIAEPGTSPHGPYNEDMVKRAFEHGMYPQGTLAWHEGASDWLPVEQFFAQPRRPATPPPLPSTHDAPQSTQRLENVSEKIYYVTEHGSTPHGPYGENELLKAYAAGQYPAGSRVWSNQTDGWIPLRKLILHNMKSQQAHRAPNEKESEAPHQASPCSTRVPGSSAASWNPFNALVSNFSRYIEFSGRSCRAEYWCYMLAEGLIYILLAVIIAALGNGISSGNPLDKDAIAMEAIISAMYTIVFFMPGMAITCRRLHDIGCNGAAGCIIMAILNIFNLAIDWSGDEGSGAFLGIVLLMSVGLIIIGCIPGKDKNNPYGYAPLSPL